MRINFTPGSWAVSDGLAKHSFAVQFSRMRGCFSVSVLQWKPRWVKALHLLGFFICSQRPKAWHCYSRNSLSYPFIFLAERKVIDVCDETPVFTGQRLKNKMQVYSGSKMAYLPTMMTLYQQCIRALQNNIDCTWLHIVILLSIWLREIGYKDFGLSAALYEIGGVPFEILEPVLERCTSEQLLRIEECNPVRS